MQGKLTVIQVDGAELVTTITGHEATSKNLQDAVGGHIETVPYFTHYKGMPCVAFCNEEGKLQGLPVNMKAQQAWEQAMGRTIREDILVGNIVVVQGDREFMREL